MRRKIYRYIILVFVLLLSGCGGSEPVSSETKSPDSHSDTPFVEEVEIPNASLKEEMEVLEELPPIPEILRPEASGVLVQENAKAVIDYSNIADGYVMVKYTEETVKRLKVQIKGPTTKYTYNIEPGEWEVFPVSDGNGEYQIGVYENAEGSKYALALSLKTTAELVDEFAPFLRPNQYVDYADAENTKQMAAVLTAKDSTELEKVASVYDYVVTNITYDTELASNVKSGYLPDLDAVLEKKTGICFDYAALMTGMLRSQSVPCKLVVGYAGEAYHAWISVYSEKDGWIDNVIYFDGTTWMRMDPTFASSGNQSESVMKYIGDGTNYTVKYLY